jgi:tetratricopeptide (TPR) repeat protein
VDCDRGLLEAARDHAATALELAREAGDPRTEADALAALGEVLGREGRHRAAAEHYRQAYALVRESSATRRRIEVLIGLAGSALRLGDLAEAGRHARSAAESAARSGYPAAAASAREVLNRVARASRPAVHAGYT